MSHYRTRWFRLEILNQSIEIDLSIYDNPVEFLVSKAEIKERIAVELGVSPLPTDDQTNFLDSSWRKVLIDKERAKIEFLTIENIDSILDKYNIPVMFGILSIDIDYNTFWIWKAMQRHYAQIIAIEYNAKIPPDENKVVQYAPNGVWDGSDYFGASILAFYLLGRERGYSLVGADKIGSNIYFVHNSILRGLSFRNINLVKELYKPPLYGETGAGHPSDRLERQYVPYVSTKYSNLKLNLGCGAEVKNNFINIDIDNRLLQYWNNIFIADMQLLPFANESVDEIYCSQILEHFDVLDIPKVLSEIDRVMNIGGHLTIFVPYVPAIVERITLTSTIEEVINCSNTIFGMNAMARGIHRILFHPIFLKTYLPNFDFQSQRIDGNILCCELIKKC